MHFKIKNILKSNYHHNPTTATPKATDTTRSHSQR